ncbi:MAG TPA: hypothetical protein PK821_07400 [Victivallales bacterium]|nr:hypothetical protein [Victivallales bacterium]
MKTRLNKSVLSTVVFAILILTYPYQGVGQSDSFGERALKILNPAKKIISTATTPTQETQWKVFGERIMLSAPENIKNGPEIDKARWVASQLAKKMAAENISPNTSYSSRVGTAVSDGWQNRDRGACGWVADTLRQAFNGAGIRYAPKDIMCTKNTFSPSSYSDPVNINHGAMAVADNGKIYLFDIWQYGRTESTFAGFQPNDKWNGIEYDQWVSEMKKQGYNSFELTDDTTTLKDWVETEAFNQKRRREALEKTKPKTDEGKWIPEEKQKPSRPEPQYFPEYSPSQQNTKPFEPESPELQRAQKMNAIAFTIRISDGHYTDEDPKNKFFESGEFGRHVSTARAKNCYLQWSGGAFSAIGSYSYDENRKCQISFSLSGTVSNDLKTLQSLVVEGTETSINATESKKTEKFSFSVSNVPLQNEGTIRTWRLQDCKIWSGKVETFTDYSNVDGTKSTFKQWGSSSDGSKLIRMEVIFDQKSQAVDF